MAIQTEYNTRMPAGLPGHIADMRGATLISRTAEGAAVAFGKPLAQGGADGGARLTTTGDTAVIGVSVRDRYVTGNDFKLGEEVRVMTRGPIFVEVVAAVSAGDPVHAIVADGTWSNTGGIEWTGARFESSADAGGLAIIAKD